MAQEPSKGLFREQALAHQKNSIAGDIVIAQPISFSIISFSLLAILLVVAVFLWLGEYSRKEVVRGYLVPSKGLLKVYSPKMAKVETLHVAEGDMVAKGAPLLTLISEHSLTTGVDSGLGRIEQLELQLVSLSHQREQVSELHSKQLNELRDSLALLADELDVLKKQELVLKQRVLIYGEQLKDIENIYANGHVTKSDYLLQKQQLLVTQQEWQELKAIIIKEQLTSKQVQYQLDQLPSRYHQQQAEIDRQVAAIKLQRLTEQKNHRLVLRASTAGTVAAIQIKESEYLTASAPLLTLLPQNSKLQAELWLPTRAAGFVQPGQTARLRFDAFPHQRFGSVTSELVIVSKSITDPKETNLPIRFDAPVYRVTADLNHQSLTAYGNELPLQAGMLLEADIILERRNLWQWLLDPLYSLRGRV